eukprot:5523633-Prymnesium_polylepis.1
MGGCKEQVRRASRAQLALRGWPRPSARANGGSTPPTCASLVQCSRASWQGRVRRCRGDPQSVRTRRLGPLPPPAREAGRVSCRSTTRWRALRGPTPTEPAEPPSRPTRPHGRPSTRAAGCAGPQ